MVTRCSLVAVGALGLLACSGAPDDHPPPAPEGGLVHVPGALAAGPSGRAPQKPANAELSIATGPLAPDFLGTLSVDVKSADGAIVSGSFEEVSTLGVQSGHELSFVLPAGERYSVSLIAIRSNAEAPTCRASIDAVSLEEGVVARAQVFGWDCEVETESVPVVANVACPRLADWSFVGRTMAELGQSVPLVVSVRAAEGARTQLAWSVPAVAFGEFSEPNAQRTEFHCAAAAAEVPLALRLTDGGCEQTVTQRIACR